MHQPPAGGERRADRAAVLAALERQLKRRDKALVANTGYRRTGPQLTDWLHGISPSGKSIAGVREQAERISRCRLTFEVHRGALTGLVNRNIVDTAMFLDRNSRIQASCCTHHAAGRAEPLAMRG